MRAPARVVCLYPLAFLAACVAPTTIQSPISQEQILREEANQREFVVRGTLEQERRLVRIAYPLLRQSRSLCPATAPKLGLRVSANNEFTREWRAAALRVGIGDTLTVTSVAEESPAGLAGIQPGDRIVAIGQIPMASGLASTKTFSEQLARLPQSTLISPPLSVNFNALLSKLYRTCCRRSGSANMKPDKLGFV